MNRELVFLIFWYFFATGSGVSYHMLDKHSQGSGDGRTFHGRYTRNIREPELLIPRHVTEDGSFLSFDLPKFYDYQKLETRKRRSADPEADTDAESKDSNEDETLHLVLPFDGVDHHVELNPHHEFISPDLVIETRGQGDASPMDLNNGIKFEKPPDLQCHYRGRIRGQENSKAALSLCEGVIGYVHSDNGQYFIEPVSQSIADDDGQHVHMIYKREAVDGSMNQRKTRTCGTDDDWESAWAEQFEKKARRERLSGNGTSVKRANESSSTHVIHRYLELAVVCDKKFLDHYKGTDYQTWVLTVMNMVSDLYHDASSGNYMDVIIVRIIYLEKEKEEMDLSISGDSTTTLNSFSAWQYKNNPKDESHPNHHDIGVLLSKWDLCAEEPAGCGLVGLAWVASACDPPKAASINEDAGILLGITVTHELGHLLGCAHDDPNGSGCKDTDTDGSSFVMSPAGSQYTLRWSPCSRKFITEYLGSGLGDCLNDNTKKPNAKYKFPGMLPGAMYDINYQCNLQFPGSTSCNYGAGNFCQRLYCKTKKGCISISRPPAEGTKCGENKWCIRTKCVEVGSRPAAVNGGWGTWGTAGPCSRTCGGGVSISERECDNPAPKDGGRYCMGLRRKFEICNTSPCDPKKPSFIATQCSEFNSKPVLADGLLHTWQPHNFPDMNPCAVYCINENHNFVELSKSAKDGTPCKGGTRNMCITGACMKVGCDWKIDSDAEEDVCGTCQGDGTRCKLVEGEFTTTGLGDYQKVHVVPKDSRNIVFMEKGSSKNVLAIKSPGTNNYILNGDHTENQSGEFPCAGDIAVYNHAEPTREEVRIRGPILEDIELQYCFYEPDHNPGVHYQYYIPSATPTRTPKYSWDFADWGDCSVKCGNGVQESTPICIEEQAGKVSNSFCEKIPRPDPKTRTCNDNPCPTKWRVSQWSRCSACAGKKGVQRRKVQCVKLSGDVGGEDIQVELTECPGDAPKQSQDCTGTRDCKDCKKDTEGFAEVRPGDEEESESETVQGQKNVIDELVDIGLARYLSRSSRGQRKTKQWSKRTPANDTTYLFDDPSLKNDPSEDRVVKHSCHKTKAKKDPAVKPGTSVTDYEKPGSAVVMVAPIVDENFKSNLSDRAFQEDGDAVSIGFDTSKQKVYTGEEADRLLDAMAHEGDKKNSNKTVNSSKN